MNENGPLKSRVDYFEDLFYRSRFSKIILEMSHLDDDLLTLSPQLVYIKSNTLYELHKISECRSMLDTLKSANIDDEFKRYAVARVAYMDEDYEQALVTFEQVYGNAKTPEQKFKSLLGIANIHLDRKHFEKIPSVIEELCSYEPLKKDADKLSLLIFLGNFYLNSGTSSELAKSYFKKALSKSAALTWTYFITRSFFGLALVAERENLQQELYWNLGILKDFVDESEQKFFSFLVNDVFKNYFSIDTPIEFDTANKRILLNNSWLPFHEKPMLFNFLIMLHNSDQFVGKSEIAVELWPEEDYKPRVHDPRIFDIAKRARNLIEDYENHPVVLLSGRLGYKLASI